MDTKANRSLTAAIREPVATVTINVRRRVKLRLFSFAAAATLAACTLWASPASAWWWDPHVDLNGNASCHSEHADMVNIRLDNGESGATIPNNYGMYFISFFRIASGGTAGTAYTRAASNGTWCSRRITVQRPATGTTQYLRLDM